MNGNNYAARFSRSGLTGGVLPEYPQSSDFITDSKIKSFNSKFFNYLEENNKKSTNNNMKAVAYMMDTNIWDKFTSYYSEFAIGGPSIELVFLSYNLYKNATYDTSVTSTTGYQVKSSNSSYGDITSGLKGTPYSVDYTSKNVRSYWTSSPSNGINALYTIEYDGYVNSINYMGSEEGFRPIVVLNSKYSLEKTKDSNDNDAFKIVEK